MIKKLLIAAIAMLALAVQGGIYAPEQDVIAHLQQDGVPYVISKFKGHDEIKAKASDGIVHVLFNAQGEAVEMSFLCQMCGEQIPKEDIDQLKSTYPVQWKPYQADDTFVSFISDDNRMIMMVGVHKPLVILTTEEGLAIHEAADGVKL